MNFCVETLFDLRGKLPAKTKVVIEIIGMAIIILTWTLVTELNLITQSILPSPLNVIASLPELHFHDAIIWNAGRSFYLNTIGLFEAVIIGIPIGMAIGLLPIFRATFERSITAARFLPLTAVVGVFIAWFGIATNMKVQFLAFSIFIYLLPVVIQRVDETEEVYVQTVKTLGASKWQTIRYVFIPTVISRVFDDIRVLAALSWTYIVVAEMVNSSGGGIGALAYTAGRNSQVDKLFAILVGITLIGFLQDKILLALDKFFFPHKYAARAHK